MLPNSDLHNTHVSQYHQESLFLTLEHHPHTGTNTICRQTLEQAGKQENANIKCTAASRALCGVPEKTPLLSISTPSVQLNPKGRPWDGKLMGKHRGTAVYSQSCPLLAHPAQKSVKQQIKMTYRDLTVFTLFATNMSFRHSTQNSHQIVGATVTDTDGLCNLMPGDLHKPWNILLKLQTMQTVQNGLRWATCTPQAMGRVGWGGGG